MDPVKLFPELPEDVSAVSDEDLAELLKEHRSAAELIDADDKEFLGEMEANEIIAQYREGANQIKLLEAEQAERQKAFEDFEAERAKISAELKGEEVEAPEEAADEPKEDDDAVVEEDPAVIGVVKVVAEVEEVETPEEEVVEEQERELVTASAQRFARRPPAPSPERTPVPNQEPKTGTALVASAAFKVDHPEPLDPESLAGLMRDVALDLGPVAHDGKGVQRMRVDPWQVDHYDDGRRVEHGGGHMIWDGPRTKVARQDIEFPEERTLNGSNDLEKIRAVLPATVQFMGKQGGHGGEALTASGGLCAPLTPLYSMPNFGTEDTPVWDSLPKFQATRGGVNVPTATYIADIETAISSISEANDALGGTFATKSCQDLDCPAYTETAVNIFAHCREYGNLNARAWPEKIAHENSLTMQALARTEEGFYLDRLKSFFPNTTNGATTLALSIFLVESIVQYRFGVIGRFRMPLNTRFRALLPYYVPDLLMLDNHATPFDRFRSKESLVDYLRSAGIDPVFYKDTPSTGDSQLPDSTQAAGAQDETPATIQWAIYPEGAVLGLDMGALELGIVRDSTLNATNDFQVFGERFRNVALIAPAQAGWWVTTTYCAGGQLPPAGTALDCPS